MMSLRTIQQRFRRDTSAVSAIEFSIWAPIMALMLLGTIDITRYTIATRRVTSVASTIGQMLSVNSSGKVSYADLQFFRDSGMIVYPQILADAKTQNIDWTNDLTITMSSVSFTAVPPLCTTTCTYVPKVDWSAGSSRRSCIVPLTSAADSAPSSSATLPIDTFGPTSVIVVDVTYLFKPLLASRYLGNLNIARSYYVSPRYVASVGYDTTQGNNGIATVCI